MTVDDRSGGMADSDEALAELAALPTPEAFQRLVAQALERSASDLFLLSDSDALRVCVRQWGIVRELGVLPVERGKQLLSHVKLMAEMDIAERRRPLDGRRELELDGRRLDLRINTIGTLFGEDMTVRLLESDRELADLDRLGLSRRDLGRLGGLIESASGLVLVTGPTGTGKTTTLYAALRRLNDGRRKINTLEDPIEYSLAGVRQSQVNPRIGVDFADLLRAVLRQAPDVIMIGEIRDPETAITAVRAANSGHLVLATMHAPTAAGAIQSLLALGVHPHFLASCLLGVVAQRLVRRLCPHCRIEYDLSEAPFAFEEIRELLPSDSRQVMYGPRGCDHCYGEGYFGRTGVFEVMTLDRDIRRAIAHNLPAKELEQKVLAAGMTSFHHAALLKVAAGETSTEEVMRTIPVEHLGLE